MRKLQFSFGGGCDLIALGTLIYVSPFAPASADEAGAFYCVALQSPSRCSVYFEMNGLPKPRKNLVLLRLCGFAN